MMFGQLDIVEYIKRGLEGMEEGKNWRAPLHFHKTKPFNILNIWKENTSMSRPLFSSSLTLHLLPFLPNVLSKRTLIQITLDFMSSSFSN